MPDGTVILPAGVEFSLEIAKALGDAVAAQKGVITAETEVLFGERMCG